MMIFGNPSNVNKLSNTFRLHAIRTDIQRGFTSNGVQTWSCEDYWMNCEGHWNVNKQTTLANHGPLHPECGSDLLRRSWGEISKSSSGIGTTRSASGGNCSARKYGSDQSRVSVQAKYVRYLPEYRGNIYRRVWIIQWGPAPRPLIYVIIIFSGLPNSLNILQYTEVKVQRKKYIKTYFVKSGYLVWPKECTLKQQNELTYLKKKLMVDPTVCIKHNPS